MTLTDEQEKVYREALEVTRKQIDEMAAQIEDEPERFQERFADVGTRKDATRQIHEGACQLLGIENDLDVSEGTKDRE